MIDLVKLTYEILRADKGKPADNNEDNNNGGNK